MKTALQIDKFITPNEEFWNELEINCVKTCCGIDAFNLDKKLFLEVIQDFNREDILKNINSVLNEIENNALKNIQSDFFNLFENKQIFKKRMLTILSFL